MTNRLRTLIAHLIVRYLTGSRENGSNSSTILSGSLMSNDQGLCPNPLASGLYRHPFLAVHPRLGGYGPSMAIRGRCSIRRDIPIGNVGYRQALPSN